MPVHTHQFKQYAITYIYSPNYPNLQQKKSYTMSYIFFCCHGHITDSYNSTDNSQ